MSELRAAVVGLGAMGRHHARLLAAEPGVELVATCDLDEARAHEHAQLRGATPLTSVDDLPSDLDAVIVSSPTTTHRAIAEPLLRAGVACLVEKPIAATLEEADALVAAAAEGGAFLSVGQVERFNPGLMRVRDQIRAPLFVESHRLGVLPERSLDIDVVLDLMIHDLDLLLWLTGSDVVDLDAIGVNVLTPRVDIANARLTFGSGCTANVTASRVSAEMTRKLRLFQSDRYVSVDFIEQSAEVVWLEGSEGGPRIARDKRERGEGEPAQEPLRNQLVAFLAALRGETSAAVTGEEGRRALAAALRVVQSMAEQVERREELRRRHDERRI